jgi:hypothetical protein
MADRPEGIRPMAKSLTAMGWSFREIALSHRHPQSPVACHRGAPRCPVADRTPGSNRNRDHQYKRQHRDIVRTDSSVYSQSQRRSPSQGSNPSRRRATVARIPIRTSSRAWSQTAISSKVRKQPRHRPNSRSIRQTLMQGDSIMLVSNLDRPGDSHPPSTGVLPVARPTPAYQNQHRARTCRAKTRPKAIP